MEQSKAEGGREQELADLRERVKQLRLRCETLQSENIRLEQMIIFIRDMVFMTEDFVGNDSFADVRSGKKTK